MTQHYVSIGDAVLDPTDGTWRIVEGIDTFGDGSVYMKDGGVMGLEECVDSHILLPSEYEANGSYARPLASPNPRNRQGQP